MNKHREPGNPSFFLSVAKKQMALFKVLLAGEEQKQKRNVYRCYIPKAQSSLS